MEINSKTKKVKFNVNEKETFYDIVSNYIYNCPKTYRKRNCNWIFVSDLTGWGREYSIVICETLGVNPISYDWSDEYEKNK